MVFDIRQDIGKTALVKALSEYDDILRKNRIRGTLKNICKKPKYIETIAGNIQYKRTMFKNKQTRKARYLLDEALKIERNQRMSLKMAQLMGLLASVGLYRATQESLNRLLRLSCSHEAIRQSVIREGKRIEKREREEHQQIKNLDYQLLKKYQRLFITRSMLHISTSKTKVTKLAIKKGI